MYLLNEKKNSLIDYFQSFLPLLSLFPSLSIINIARGIAGSFEPEVAFEEGWSSMGGIGIPSNHLSCASRYSLRVAGFELKKTTVGKTRNTA